MYLSLHLHAISLLRLVTTDYSVTILHLLSLSMHEKVRAVCAEHKGSKVVIDMDFNSYCNAACVQQTVRIYA